MSITPNDDMTHKLADEFSRIVRDWLSPAEMAEVLSRNRTYPPSVCATHDFRDANLAMAEAFGLVAGRRPDLQSEADAALWSVAWVRARNAQFQRKLQPTTNAEGALVQAYMIKGAYIYDPYLSECGKYAVDPADYHGLRPEELAALESANSKSKDNNAGAPSSNGDEHVENGGARVGSVTALRALYPNLQVWHTDSGCFALRHDCDDGGYLLITDSDGAQIPENDATEVNAGRYAANGDIVLDAKMIPIIETARWIDAELAGAADPTNIADYFVKQLGAGPVDKSLRELPMHSPCGLDCANAIDAAAALLAHVRTACGNDDDLSTRAVVETARRVVGVYWRG